MKIHTFGDSHSNSGWMYFKNENIERHPLGPRLCYSFGRDKLNLLNIKEFGVEENDIVIFCFGEIDLRCNIQKHLNNEYTYDKNINSMIEKYFEAIYENVKQYSHLNVCVYNVVPTVQKYNTFEYPNHPFMGTDEERKMYVQYFNKKCDEYCLKYNYTFFNVYDKYCDSNGYLNKDYSDDNVHVYNGIYIFNFLYHYINKLIENETNILILNELEKILYGE